MEQQGRVWGRAVIVCKSVQSPLCKNYCTGAGARRTQSPSAGCEVRLSSDCEDVDREQLAGYLVGIYDTNNYDIECSS